MLFYEKFCKYTQKYNNLQNLFGGNKNNNPFAQEYKFLDKKQKNKMKKSFKKTKMIPKNLEFLGEDRDNKVWWLYNKEDITCYDIESGEWDFGEMKFYSLDKNNNEVLFFDKEKVKVKIQNESKKDIKFEIYIFYDRGNFIMDLNEVDFLFNIKYHKLNKIYSHNYEGFGLEGGESEKFDNIEDFFGNDKFYSWLTVPWKNKMNIHYGYYGKNMSASVVISKNNKIISSLIGVDTDILSSTRVHYINLYEFNNEFILHIDGNTGVLIKIIM
jgi:hypothetical protein